MIDERTRTLIELSIDGCLSAAEQAELDQAAGASPDVRRELTAMQKLDTLLTNAPTEDPPAGLHGRIVDAVALPSPPPARPAPWPAVFRYGLATAAGVLITMGVYESGPAGLFDRDVRYMLGTTAPMSAGPELDRYSVDEPGLRSSARLEQREGALVLDVMLDSEHAVDVTVDLGATGLHVDSVAKMRSQFESLELANGAIRTRSRGQQRFSALLRPMDTKRSDKDAVVTIAFSRDGTLLKQGALKPVK